MADVPQRPTDPIEQFFRYEHLPPKLQEISIPFHDMARRLVSRLPRNPERSVALRKLLESKDAAVRAALYEETGAAPAPASGT